ncbi:MAG TPA: TonB-dependent receptor [Xanthomonadaceae bacterium]|nr:TonB-dependent receptor [Xanthomonadaceae bacterium]
MSRLTLGLLAALAAAPVFAQSTTAGVSGEVVSATGQPVAGAEVSIVHTESGTVSRATTDAEGRFDARGLRVGGPYTITVNKAGEGAASEENLYFALDQVAQVEVQLVNDVTTLETVTAVGVRGSDVFDSMKMGTGTNVDREQIEAFASIQRSIQDYARLDPRIAQTDKERGEISALGQNTRFNSITIDRVSTNDSFGLESNNLPTIKQPISIDAIEEIQVNVANYDVTQKGYTGANINAVTKSGTNNFDGSVYYVYREADWVGEDEDGNPFTGFDDETTYGMTLGGPIVKDKLFFFASYENFERTAPGAEFGPAGSGATNEYEDFTVADVQAAIAAAAALGFPAGSSNPPASLGTEIEDKLVKLDWNINDYHRASLRYNKTEQNEAVLPNIDNDEYSLSSHWYNQDKTFETVVGQLFSDWTMDFSTEVAVSHRDYHSEPIALSRLPQLRIDYGDTVLYMGREQFRHANVLDTQTLNAFAAANWYLGDHELKFGVDYDKNDIYNLFVESSLGAYGFDNPDDFADGIYEDYALRVAAPGQNPAAEFTLENLGLFVQDTWTVNDALTLTAGVRIDTPIIDDKPLFNEDASEFFGFRNDATVDGNELIQPRFGFNYTFDSELRTQLRGGFGLFQGAAANVWLSNPFTNNGLTIDVYGCGFGFSTRCNRIDDLPPFSADPDNQPFVGDAPAADIDFLHPGLNQPSVWKANLAVDHELPWWGMVASAEVVLSRVNTGIYYEHLNLGAPTGVAPDGRLLFWETTDGGEYDTRGQDFEGGDRANANTAYREVLLARETDKGRGETLTVSLMKPLDESWFWQLAYTYTNATEVSPLTSSRAISNWNGRSVFNPNENVASKSNYLVKDRFTAAVSYRHYFFENYKTEVSMFYEGREGKPYSWTFDNDANGDGIFGNDLVFVPTNPGDVQWVGGAADAAAWANFVSENPGLARFRGDVATRNSETNPWVNTFDVRISQELPGFFGDNKAEIWLDILNIGNLINDDWGRIEEIGFPLNRGVVEFAGITDDGRYIYDFTRPDTSRLRDTTGESRWALQVGFRYKF